MAKRKPKPPKAPQQPWIATLPKPLQLVIQTRGGYMTHNRHRWTSEEAKAARRRSKRHPVKEGE